MKKFAPVVFCSIFLLSLSIIVPASAYEDITPEEVKQKLDAEEDVFILDVRRPDEYAQGYVPSAYLIPLSELEGRLGEVPEDRPVIVVCKSGGRSAQASRMLDDNGFGDISNMTGGTLAWINLPAYISIKGMDLWDQLTAPDAFILDVRDEDEYEREHIEATVLMPFDQLETHLDEIPQDKVITVIGKDDPDGARAAEKLIELGYTGVRNLEGGMRDWDFATAVSGRGKAIATFAAVKTIMSN